MKKHTVLYLCRIGWFVLVEVEELETYSINCSNIIVYHYSYTMVYDLGNFEANAILYVVSILMSACINQLLQITYCSQFCIFFIEMYSLADMSPSNPDTPIYSAHIYKKNDLSRALYLLHIHFTIGSSNWRHYCPIISQLWFRPLIIIIDLIGKFLIFYQ